MKPHASTVAACILGGCLITAVAEPVALFNGRDLQGWTFDLQGEPDPQTTWSVQDGLLVCQGKPPGVIRTEKEYGNYELTVEWRWTPGTAGGNSGVLIHCSKPRELGIWPRSLEVQLGKGNAGDFWTIRETIEVDSARQPAKGRRILNLTDDSEKPVGEWNTLRVRCAGRQVSVWVNGDKVNEGSNCSASAGAICLQSEGAPIQFRTVELNPLPGAGNLD
jgi:hypothetical protein